MADRDAIPSAIRVAVFAHNEERHVGRAVASILEPLGPGADVRVYVLVNGCTDGTYNEACRLGRQYGQAVVPVKIALGDKCHAWNTYVHELADDSPCHVFLDGDVRVHDRSLIRMQQELLRLRAANAVAGLPLSGRGRRKYAELVRERLWIFANFYCVKGTHLAEIRRRGIRLPLGLVWEDHALTRLMHSPDAPMSSEFRYPDRSEAHVVYVDGAGYAFRSLSPVRPADVRLYFRRKVRYRLAYQQLVELRSQRVSELPPTMDDVNRTILRQLEDRRLPLTDWVGRQLRVRLRRMYPEPGSRYLGRQLDEMGTDWKCG